MDNLENMPVEERLKYLRDSADHVVENMEYSRQLTDTEIRQAKDKLTDITIAKSAIENEKKEVTKDYNRQIKDHSESQHVEMEKVKTGFITTNGTVFELVDYEEMMVYQYDSYGVFIRKRPAEARDRQTRIRALEGTNE